MADVKVSKSHVVMGRTVTFSETLAITGGVYKSEEYAAAKAGTLTTRTSASVGTLTMASGHGITNGAKLDIYWEGGYRANVTVGTVASLSVPFSLGGGIDLPAATTAVTAMVVNQETFVVATAAILSISIGCSGVPMIARFVDDADADIVTIPVVPGAAGYCWAGVEGDGANPIDDDCAKVFLTHGSSAGAKSPFVHVGT